MEGNDSSISTETYQRQPTPPIDALDLDNEEFGGGDIPVFCVIVTKIGKNNDTHSKSYV